MTGIGDSEKQEIITDFIKQFYVGTPFIPKEILTQEEVLDQEILEKWLSDKRGSKVIFAMPKRGSKHQMMELARKNAQNVLAQDSEKLKREERRTTGAVHELEQALGIGNLNRMEAFDISNTNGYENVASMVVFEKGKAKRSDYRKFKIKTVAGPDDYHCMEEALERRFSHGIREQKEREEKGQDMELGSFTRFPDILIVNLVRCAWLGSQKYGALVWSGDILSTYEDFRKQICAGLHMGLCGIPWWTTDIGGFHGGVTEDPDFRELLVRWFQFGTFCPVMRIHGNRGPREEIINKAGEVREGTGADNEVWSFGEKNYEILTKFIGVREKMRDYTRSLMAEAHKKGTPVMRTMFYEFPEDAACWNISDAYMFGSDILVAPIVRPKATSRTVYLPAGASWTLANTGDVYEGGKAYEIDAPIETLPVFLRDGKQGYLVREI